MTVQVALRPQIFLVVGEVSWDLNPLTHPPTHTHTHTHTMHSLLSLTAMLKRKMTRVDKIKLKGWRSKGRGTVARRNSQIGQLLYYLVAVQLQQIQLYLSPTEREFEHDIPAKTLGLFIEGKVSKQGLL